MTAPRDAMGAARRLARWAAIGFGAGRAPFAPGTFGTLLAVPLYLAVQSWSPAAYAALVAALFGAGVWFCHMAAQDMGEPDPSAVVWDEVVGYLVAMFQAPAGWPWIVGGFLLFRLFDIWKPFPIRRLERRLPGGWGVMVDDVLAGVYAGLVLHGAAWLVGRAT
jgi:phosphatidylglycerophosphatase A